MRRQLGQRFERWRLQSQLEQQPVELEQQQRVPRGGLRFHPDIPLRKYWRHREPVIPPSRRNLQAKVFKCAMESPHA
jgi:hypothetical protein